MENLASLVLRIVGIQRGFFENGMKLCLLSTEKYKQNIVESVMFSTLSMLFITVSFLGNSVWNLHSLCAMFLVNYWKMMFGFGFDNCGKA